MNMIMMSLMLFCLYGITGFLYTGRGNCQKTFTSAQCFALTVILVIGVQALFSLIGRLIPCMTVGVILLLLLGIYGHIRLLSGNVSVRGKSISLTPSGKTALAEFYSPALLLAGVAFVGTLFLMRGMLVYRYDDLKQWGSAAKFLVENEALPRENEFFGSLNHYLTPTFFTSFFGIGGKWVTGKLVEHNLYAANMLFAVTGLILPLGELGWKQFKKAACIFVLSLLGVTALYYHSTANLYVDVILAAWVGGMIGFILLRRRLKGPFDRKTLGFIIFVLAFTIFIKWGYGILGVALILAAWCIVEYSMRKPLADATDRMLKSKRFWGIAALAAVICGVIIWLLSIIFGDDLNKILPGAGSLITSLLDILFSRTDKAALTLNACIMGLFDQNVTRGTFSYGTLAALILLGGLGYLQIRGIESAPFAKLVKRLHTAWLAGSTLWFALILVTYVSNFAYAEATIALSFNRYMGIYLMIGYFVMLLVLFAPEEYLAARKLQDGKYVFAPSGKRSKGITVRGLMQILLVTVLVLNINTALVTESTGLNTDEIVGYSNVNAVHEQSNTVKCLTGEDDDILFIAQKGAERSLHRARFDVGMNVSGYLPNTYHFSETADAGYDLSVIRSPKELPQLLIDGGYEYVWVYKTDTELNDFAEGYFGMKLKNATLYRVFVQNGTVTLSRVSGLE